MKQAVIGIIFSTDLQKVLVLRRRDVDVWVFPGGGVENDELPEKAIIREILEETGMNVSIKRKIGEYTPINSLASFTQVYECHATSGKLLTGDETREIGFFPIHDLPKFFFPLHEDWLKDALEKNPNVIKKPIYQVTYIQCLKYFFLHPLKVLRFAMSRIGFPINYR